MAKKKLSELTEKTTLHKDDLLYLVDSEVSTGKGKKVKYGTIRPCKVYTALLTQTSENAPVATVLENTLGGELVWTRFAEGVYSATLADAFTENKTVAILTSTKKSEYVNAHYIDWESKNVLQLISYIYKVEFLASDNILSDTLIEIRVYN